MVDNRQLGETILSVDNVSLSFGGVKALTDVSFDVKEGEVRAIIGPNGAGKSSMLNCINGFYKPTEGTITFKGESHSQMETQQAASLGIARTFQNIALFQKCITSWRCFFLQNSPTFFCPRSLGVSWRYDIGNFENLKEK